LASTKRRYTSLSLYYTGHRFSFQSNFHHTDRWKVTLRETSMCTSSSLRKANSTCDWGSRTVCAAHAR
jgi:hypothetical protein